MTWEKQMKCMELVYVPAGSAYILHDEECPAGMTATSKSRLILDFPPLLSSFLATGYWQVWLHDAAPDVGQRTSSSPEAELSRHIPDRTQGLLWDQTGTMLDWTAPPHLCMEQVSNIGTPANLDCGTGLETNLRLRQPPCVQQSESFWNQTNNRKPKSFVSYTSQINQEDSM